MVEARHRKPTSELRSVTCHTGSRGVTCPRTQVNAPRRLPRMCSQSIGCHLQPTSTKCLQFAEAFCTYFSQDVVSL